MTTFATAQEPRYLMKRYASAAASRYNGSMFRRFPFSLLTMLCAVANVAVLCLVGQAVLASARYGINYRNQSDWLLFLDLVLCVTICGFLGYALLALIGRPRRIKWLTRGALVGAGVGFLLWWITQFSHSFHFFPTD